MALTFEEIRQRLLAQQNQKDRKTGGGNDNATYAFWDNPDGSTATLRFLPDGNQSNDFWWEERLVIKLPFNGVKGQHSKQIEVQVPCMDKWKANSCPILAETRPWWKGGKDLEDMARKYWKKKSYIFQGFVVSNPNAEDMANLPENPIRRFLINTSVFDRIKVAFLDQDVESSPVDYNNGLDFRLVKGTKGAYADYGASTWSRKERALSEDEYAAIDKYGLFNLSDYLPKKPDEEHLKIIMELFRDSVDGLPYDPDKYLSSGYKPYGLRNDNSATQDSDDSSHGSTRTTVSVRTPNITVKTPSDDDDDVPFDVGNKPAKEEAKKITNPQEVLEALRRRQSKA